MKPTVRGDVQYFSSMEPIAGRVVPRTKHKRLPKGPMHQTPSAQASEQANQTDEQSRTSLHENTSNNLFVPQECTAQA